MLLSRPPLDLFTLMWHVDPSLLNRGIVWPPLKHQCSGSVPPPLSHPPSRRRTGVLGANWILNDWLSSLLSAGCERGHLSRALRGGRAEGAEGFI